MRKSGADEAGAAAEPLGGLPSQFHTADSVLGRI